MFYHAEKEGVVSYVDSKEIHIKYKLSQDDVLVSFDTDTTVYNLIKFQKTNQGSAVNLRPIVKKGDKVVKGQVFVKVMVLIMVN